MKSTLALLLAFSCNALMAAPAIMEPPMVLIPAGSFAMGDASAKPIPNYPSPFPVHQVRIAAFQMAKYEVTVSQFRQFIEATGYKAESSCWKHTANDWGMSVAPGSWSANAYPHGEQLPVMCVSPLDAKAYIKWLAKETRKPYRLPSEAEWEYAARAGSKDAYHFGVDLPQSCRYANTLDKTGSPVLRKMTGKTGEGKTPPCDDGVAFTSVPGMFEANAFGLFDMVGNLKEFVEDCQHDSYEGAPADGSAWTTNCSKEMMIRRGGSYTNRDSSTWRGHASADNSSSFDGFRVALGSPGPVRDTQGARRFEADLEKARAAARAARKLAP